MSSPAAKEISTLIKEAEELRHAAQSFSAMARLARVDLLLPRLSVKEKTQVHDQLEAIEFSQSEIARARDSAREYLSKLTRIFSVSSKYSFEELAWIVTLRTELWLVQGFFHAHSYGDLGMSVGEVDKEITHLIHDPVTGKSVESADRHVRKHGGISLADIGLIGGS